MILLLALIVIFFLVGILLRKVFPRLCAICFATSATWIIGLIYILINGNNVKEVDIISLGILMGGSVVGSMYYLFSKLSEGKQLFKLPYLITLFTIVYIVLVREYVELMIIIGNGILWFIFFILYWARDNNYFRRGVGHIIECCKNW